MKINTTASWTQFIHKARAYAIICHSETNHKYDNKPYETHLEMVVEYAYKYGYLINSDHDLDQIIASCWVHDTIEDCRQTYNDVRNELGIPVAEITYALTNEKGRNRKERANDAYYNGIRNNPLATYVKICDRLANVRYSSDNKSKMIEVYKKEHPNFMKQLFTVEFQPMWDELSNLLS